MTGLQVAQALSRRPRPPRAMMLKLVAEGHTSRGIAEMLWISEKTVHRHRASILANLGLRDRVDPNRYAIWRGLVAP